MSGERPLNTPPGYGNIVPFDRDVHRDLSGPSDYRFAAGLHAIYLSAQEFFHAAADYPIVFFTPSEGEWLPLALTGLSAGRNLFVDEEGVWRAGAYVPAYVRRYPFCTVALAENDGNESQFAIWVDADALRAPAAAELPYIDSHGQPTAAWLARERLIREMESARMTTDAFIHRLNHLALFEAFEAHAQPARGAPMLVKGLYRVSEDKLNALPGEAVKELMHRGELSRIYAHLMSLDNFTSLLDLEVAATAG